MVYETEGEVSIVTKARPIRAFNRLIDPIDSEFRLEISDDGIYTEMVDTANVMMASVNFDPAYENVLENDFVFGLDQTIFSSILQYARMTQNDPVRVDIEDREFTVEVEREDESVIRKSFWYGLDPNVVRGVPDVSGLEDGLTRKVTIDSTKALSDASDNFPDGRSVEIYSEGEDLVFVLDPKKIDSDRFTFTDCYEVEGGSEDESTLLSPEYLEKALKAVHRAKMDTVEIRWGSSYPVTIEFEREEWGIDGRYAIAPRMES